jgi:hypothetical protein
MSLKRSGTAGIACNHDKLNIAFVLQFRTDPRQFRQLCHTGSTRCGEEIDY